MPKVHILPLLPRGEDPGDGGIRQVVKAQHEWLPQFGWEIEPDPALADVIACHVEIPATYLRNYGHKPIVVHNHGAYWTPDYQWVQWCYAANGKVIESLRVADITTAVSEWTAQTLRRHSNRDIRVVHHGVNLDEWTPSGDTPGQYVLWNKTRVDPICDPRPMLELADRMPHVPFVTTFSANDQRPQNVQVLGRLPYEESKRWVRDAAIYLCTTRETFGIGTLEALACGVPVVGYRFGGQAEIIEHGVDGWLVPEGDIDGLIEGINWALGNVEARAAARRKAEQFPVAASVGKYAEVYAEALERYTRERPKVSVIVTAYNLAQYLPATLDSVRMQEGVDWECIVVDDASPDQCGEIADAYAEVDTRFHVVHNPENLYLAGARNAGIEASDGDYILPLDADDMLPPGTLAALAGALDTYRGLDIAYGNVLFVDEDGRTPTNYGSQFPPGHSGWPVDFRLDWMLQRPGQPMPYSSMFRRRVWELTGGYRRRARTSEDCDMWLRATSYGFLPAMVTQGDTLIYRNRPGSMSRVEGFGDEQHRRWFPWINDWSKLPAAAYRGSEVTNDQIAFQSWDPPIISVVIPVGPGHGRWVIDAIDSVDAQTFRLWECIVANDSGEPLPRMPQWVKIVEPEACERCGGSGEATQEDLDGRTTHWGPCDRCGGTGHGRFGGVAAARNAAIRASRGALFLPLDADDYLQPDALQIMLDAHMDDIEHRPIVYSDFWDEKEPGVAEVWECPDYNPRDLTRRGLGRAVTALTPRRYWVAIGGYDEDVAWEDWMFALRCAEHGFCERRVAAPLLNYRKYTGSRAGEMHANHEESKASIMAKGFTLQGGELMACGSCPGGRSTTYGGYSPAQAKAGAPMAPPPEGAVMVQYTGPRAGDVYMRSSFVGQPRYVFSLASPLRWVRAEDVDFFQRHQDFKVLGPAGLVAIGGVGGNGRELSPALVAAGPPNAPAAPTQFAGLKSFQTEAVSAVSAEAELSVGTIERGDQPSGIAAFTSVAEAHEQAPLGMPSPAPAPSAPLIPEVMDRPAPGVVTQVTGKQSRVSSGNFTPTSEEDDLTRARREADANRAAGPTMGEHTDQRARELTRQTREELNEQARALGIVEPEELDNKMAVARAIVMMQEVKAS